MSQGSDVIAIVLAAGRARRFGQDKRLVEMDDGKSLLQATLESVSQCFETVMVVLREDDDSEALQLDPKEVIRSANADRGLGFSIAAGFSALGHSQAVAAAVILGDMPCILPATYRITIERAGAGRIVRPTFHGRAGHPVVFGRNFWPELARLQSEEGARAVIHGHLDACMHIEVDDPGVLMDADCPEDLEALRERYRLLTLV